MALTTEQVFALGILYNKLATIVYGEDGPKANNLQNATMYPLMEIAQLILRATGAGPPHCSNLLHNYRR